MALGRRRAIASVGAASLSWVTHYRRVAQVLKGDDSAGSELAWLAAQAAPAADRTLVDVVGTTGLIELAQGYERHATRLAARILIRPDSVIAVQRQLDLATATASALQILGARVAASGQPAAPMAHSAARGLALTPLAVPQQGARAFAYDLVISYRPFLVAPILPGATWQDFVRAEEFRPVDLDPESQRALARRFGDAPGTSAEFDGLLPRLGSWRAERELASGRYRLVLSLTATSYSAVVADHYCGEAQHRRLASGSAYLRVRGVRTTDVSGENVRLLTLAMAPVTRDGYLLFVGRSQLAGSHEGMVGPAVSGNLELRARAGVAVDRDAFGVPDPLAALAREGREELGLAVERDAMHAAGLVQFDSPSEQGTFVLLGTTILSETLDEVAAGAWRADVVEGRWEVGNELIGLRVPSTDEQARAAVSWLWNSPELTPAATAAGLATLGTMREVCEWGRIPIEPGVAPPSLTRRPIW